MRYRYFIPLVLLIAAVFFMGRGLTGMVVSQSCCFGENCSPDDLCDVAQKVIEKPMTVSEGVSGIYVGGALVFISVFMYILLHRWQRPYSTY